MQIDHIALWTKDIERIRTFYLKYFACKSNEKYINKKKQFSSYFLSFADGARIELMSRVDVTTEQKSDRIGLAHFAISVGTREKVDALTVQIRRDGYIIESEPRLTGDGYYESVILDPEKNKIELTSIEEYTISEAEQADLENILYLQKCCYLSEAEIYQDFTIPPIVQTVIDARRDFETQSILKLVVGNEIIGSVRAYMEENTCFISKLIVERQFQNMGFGKLLLKAIEEKFPHAQRFELFTGDKSRKNLLLYQKVGYREFSREQTDSITMVFLEKINPN